MNLYKINCASIVFFLVLLVSACGDDVVLLKELSEPDANEMIGVLLSSGIDARKKIEKKGVSVIIDSNHMAHAVSILKSAGLPNKNQVTLGDVFKKEGVISTPLEERARYIYALSQELEFTLSQIDHVIVATGHFSVPNVPEYPGFETFNGRLLHAHDFRDAREFTGKDIMIMGTSKVGLLSILGTNAEITMEMMMALMDSMMLALLSAIWLS